MPFAVRSRDGERAHERAVRSGVPRAAGTLDVLACFTIDREGPWLIKTVHMVRLPETAADADWERYWVTRPFNAAAP